MISTVELAVLLVYIGMALYIVYLQDKLKKSERFGSFLAMLVQDVVNGDVEIHKTTDGFQVKRKGDSHGNS
jgi:hypothetical protein